MIHHFSETRDKKHIISIDAEKAFDKSATIHDKNTQQGRFRGNKPQQIRAICEKPKANIILTGKNSFSPMIRNKCVYSHHFYSI